MNDARTERRRRALAIFDVVIDLDGDSRERQLEQLCADDAELRALVHALLDADRSATEPFGGDASAWGDALARETDDAQDPMIGRSIGAWRIIDVIGRGGMGLVYRVERNDGAYAQQAALKLIRISADSPIARERFLRERQIQARLQHPNIATLLDGGISAEHEPYFVMELVDGMPIDQWCDARTLGLRERVVLFLQLLDAVRYAHRNLVVHRDLKPSNLLVDAEGRLKLLDFGIAKQLEASDVTATHDRALTFEYASPEQLHDAPITTATDVWQLGVVLHRLLSGAHPFGLSRDTPVAKQLQQLEREPEPLTRAAAQSSIEQAARRGGHTPLSLARALRGNLAEVVQACLRRNPETRYASADALSGDLRAWLDDRPIAALRLSRGERARLWLRRNRTLAASVTAIAIALFAGTGVALWQAHQARMQAQLAERQSANARASIEFLTDTLAAAAPEQAMSTEVSVRQLLDKARVKLDQRSLDPLVRKSVQRLLGRLYGSLDQPGIAIDLFAAGLQGVQPAQRAEGLALADDLVGYSDALGDLERNAESLAAAERAVDLRQRFAPDDPEQRLRALAHITIGHVEKYGLAWCRQRAEQALAFAKRMPAPPVDVVLDIYSDIGTGANFQNDRVRLLAASREGLAYADAHHVPIDSPARTSLLSNLVAGLVLDARPAEAERLIRQAIASGEKVGGFGGASINVMYQALATTLLAQNNFREALETLEASYAQSVRSGEGPRNLATALSNLAFVYSTLGDYPTALARSQQAIATMDRGKVPADDMFRRSLERVHARVLLANERNDEARALLQVLQERSRRLDGQDSEEYLQVVGEQLNLALRTQDVVHGLPLLAEARQRASKRGLPETGEQFAHFLGIEASFDRLRGDAAAAEHHRREALRRLQAFGNAPDIATMQARLASDLAHRGKTPEAHRLLVAALAVMRATYLPEQRDRVAAETLSKQLGG